MVLLKSRYSVKMLALGLSDFLSSGVIILAAGKSSYEVVNQVERDKAYPQDQDRSLDTTLMINGLPLIHIELKSLVWPFWMPFIKSKNMTVKVSYVASILPPDVCCD